MDSVVPADPVPLAPEPPTVAPDGGGGTVVDQSDGITISSGGSSAVNNGNNVEEGLSGAGQGLQGSPKPIDLGAAENGIQDAKTGEKVATENKTQESDPTNISNSEEPVLADNIETRGDDLAKLDQKEHGSLETQKSGQTSDAATPPALIDDDLVPSDPESAESSNAPPDKGKGEEEAPKVEPLPNATKDGGPITSESLPTEDGGVEMAIPEAEKRSSENSGLELTGDDVSDNITEPSLKERLDGLMSPALAEHLSGSTAEISIADADPAKCDGNASDVVPSKEQEASEPVSTDEGGMEKLGEQEEPNDADSSAKSNAVPVEENKTSPSVEQLNELKSASSIQKSIAGQSDEVNSSPKAQVNGEKITDLHTDEMMKSSDMEEPMDTSEAVGTLSQFYIEQLNEQVETETGLPKDENLSNSVENATANTVSSPIQKSPSKVPNEQVDDVMDTDEAMETPETNAVEKLNEQVEAQIALPKEENHSNFVGASESPNEHVDDVMSGNASPKAQINGEQITDLHTNQMTKSNDAEEPMECDSLETKNANSTETRDPNDVSELHGKESNSDGEQQFKETDKSVRKNDGLNATSLGDAAKESTVESNVPEIESASSSLLREEDPSVMTPYEMPEEPHYKPRILDLKPGPVHDNPEISNKLEDTLADIIKREVELKDKYGSSMHSEGTSSSMVPIQDDQDSESKKAEDALGGKETDQTDEEKALQEAEAPGIMVDESSVDNSESTLATPGVEKAINKESDVQNESSEDQSATQASVEAAHEEKEEGTKEDSPKTPTKPVSAPEVSEDNLPSTSRNQVATINEMKDEHSEGTSSSMVPHQDDQESESKEAEDALGRKEADEEKALQEAEAPGNMADESSVDNSESTLATAGVEKAINKESDVHKESAEDLTVSDSHAEEAMETDIPEPSKSTEAAHEKKQQDPEEDAPKTPTKPVSAPEGSVDNVRSRSGNQVATINEMKDVVEKVEDMDVSTISSAAGTSQRIALSRQMEGDNEPSLGEPVAKKLKVKTATPSHLIDLANRYLRKCVHTRDPGDAAVHAMNQIINDGEFFTEGFQQIVIIAFDEPAIDMTRSVIEWMVKNTDFKIATAAIVMPPTNDEIPKAINNIEIQYCIEAPMRTDPLEYYGASLANVTNIINAYDKEETQFLFLATHNSEHLICGPKEGLNRTKKASFLKKANLTDAQRRVLGRHLSDLYSGQLTQNIENGHVHAIITHNSFEERDPSLAQVLEELQPNRHNLQRDIMQMLEANQATSEVPNLYYEYRVFPTSHSLVKIISGEIDQSKYLTHIVTPITTITAQELGRSIADLLQSGKLTGHKLTKGKRFKSAYSHGVVLLIEGKPFIADQDDYGDPNQEVALTCLHELKSNPSKFDFVFFSSGHDNFEGDEEGVAILFTKEETEHPDAKDSDSCLQKREAAAFWENFRDGKHQFLGGKKFLETPQFQMLVIGGSSIEHAAMLQQ